MIIDEKQQGRVYATIVIDDPLLRRTYGYLDYLKLLDCMDQLDFHTTIAFIPWNYKRTSKAVADLFTARPDRFSLCVHGCDHTWGEFGLTNKQLLLQKVRLATARMIEHRKQTGIEFDRVMVFPQGIYSNQALGALEECNYLAAVNTTAEPVDGEDRIDFPFYQRCTPENVSKSCRNTCFVALHHDFFKNGYCMLEKLIDKINSNFSSVGWGSIGENLRRLGLKDNFNSFENLPTDLSGLELNGISGNTRIRLRRSISEFRDNVLVKNPVSNSIYRIVRGK